MTPKMLIPMHHNHSPSSYYKDNSDNSECSNHNDQTNMNIDQNSTYSPTDTDIKY